MLTGSVVGIAYSFWYLSQCHSL